jgi:high-affinity nickel-transport protein
MQSQADPVVRASGRSLHHIGRLAQISSRSGQFGHSIAAKRRGRKRRFDRFWPAAYVGLNRVLPLEVPVLRSLLDDSTTNLRGKVIGLYGLLLAANVAAWGWALLAFGEHPVLLGTALLAYTFGLRHAVDADHIAAIDSVTRKLVQQGKRPIATGFWFSLGHSSVVILATAVLVLTTAALQSGLEDFKQIGSLIGTSVSAIFLLLIAAVNTVILVGVWRSFQRVRRGGALVEADLDLLLAQRGLLGRLFRPLFRLIGKSWHMYPLGFLFGIGFDTASEIGLLGIAAGEAAKGLSVWTILVFPALFTAGMALIDTTDSVMMQGAYGWALAKPIRKLYYNLTITFVSVAVALLIGGIEALALLSDKLGLEGGFWDFIAHTAGNFGALGFAIVGIFALCWAIFAVVYKLKRIDEIEVKTG